MHSQNSLLLALAVVGAALFAGLRKNDEPVVAPPHESAAPMNESANDTEQESLPPNHPPIGDTPMNGAPGANEEALPSDHPMMGDMPMNGMQGPGMMQGKDGPPAITWKAPPGWVAEANKSAMRLATYRIPGKSDAESAELSVVRAGGSTSANIERWIKQFSDATPPKRAERKIHGLSVSTLELSGTFAGGGMMGNGAAASHPGWMLEGAVVETADGTYFFKLTGPSATVSAARAAFDALVDSVAPAGSTTTL